MFSKDTPIIFLDVDGVLNSHGFFQRQHDSGKLKSHEDHIDPDAVKRLQRICDATGAEIVVSSTWRNGSLFDILINTMKRHGLTAEVVGKTTTRYCQWCLRGNQIRQWIHENVDEGYNFKRFVILDDDSDMLLWQKDNFVQTSAENGGLTDELADKAINILNNPPSGKTSRILLPK